MKMDKTLFSYFRGKEREAVDKCLAHLPWFDELSLDHQRLFTTQLLTLVDSWEGTAWVDSQPELAARLKATQPQPAE